MKRLLLIGFLITPLLMSAQSPLGENGNQFSLASGYTTTGIPVYLNFEMGIFERISFGIEGNLRFYNEAGDTTDYSHTIMGMTFFSNYYFNEIFNLDDMKWGVYAGIHLGYFKWISPEGYVESGSSSSTLAGGIQLGGRYYFKEKWGVFIELSGDNDSAGGKLGATFRLP